MAQFYTDFENDYSVGDTPSNIENYSGGTVPTVINHATHGQLYDAGTYGALLYKGLTASSTIEVLYELVWNGGSYDIAWLLPFHTASGSGTEGSGYGLHFGYTTRFVRITNSAISNLSTTTAPTPRTSGTIYYVRVQRTGTSLNLKFWLAGDSEPVGWNQSITDSNHTVQYPGFRYGTTSENSVYLKSFGVGTDGDPAPSSTPVTDITISVDPLTATTQLEDSVVLAEIRIPAHVDADVSAATATLLDSTVTATTIPGLNPQIQADNPILWWSFDEASGAFTDKGIRTGQNVPWTTPQNLTPTEDGNLLRTQAGGINPTVGDYHIRAMSYLGSMTNNAWWYGASDPDPRGLTFECLFKIDSSTVTGDYIYNNITGANQFGFMVEVAGSQLLVDIVEQSSKTEVLNFSFTPGQWQHLVITFSRLNTGGTTLGPLTSKAYINSALADSGTYQYAGNWNVWGKQQLKTSGYNLDIDELAIYKKALTEADIIRHYETLEAPAVSSATIYPPLLGDAVGTLLDATITSDSNADISLNVLSATASINDSVVVAEDLSGAFISAATLGATAVLDYDITVIAETPNVNVDVDTAEASAVMQLAFEAITLPYNQIVSALNPIHYWRMNETSGSTLVDAQGTKNLGLTSSITSIPGVYGAEGQVGVSIPNRYATGFVYYNTEVRSFEFWMKKDGVYTQTTHVNNGTAYIFGGGNPHEDNGYLPDKVYYGGFGIKNGQFVWNTGSGADNLTFAAAPTDSNWHHIVFQSKPDLTEVWVDGIKMYSAPVSRRLNYNNRAFNGIYGTRNSVDAFGSTAGIAYDEFAVHGSFLTQAQITEHYSSGRGTNHAEIIMPTSMATAQLHAPEYKVTVEAAVMTATASVRTPATLINGGPRISVEAAEVAAVLPTPELTVVAHKEIEAQTAKATAGGHWVYQRLYLGTYDYKIIKATDTSLTSADAEALLELDLGAVLKDETRVLAFKLGNQSTQNTGFELTFISNNPVVDHFKLSKDKVNWDSGIIIETMPPNAVSDVFWIKVEPTKAMAEGNITVLLNVEQIDV